MNFLSPAEISEGEKNDCVYYPHFFFKRTESRFHHNSPHGTNSEETENSPDIHEHPAVTETRDQCEKSE